MKKNKFWVLEKILKLEKKEEIENVVETKKQTTLRPDQEWSIKEKQELEKSEIDDSIQVSISGNKENMEIPLSSKETVPKKSEKKVPDGVLDFKFSLRVITSNAKDGQPISELQSEQSFQGQSHERTNTKWTAISK